MAVLQSQLSGLAQMQAEIAALKAQLAAAQSSKRRVTLSVGKSGTVQVNGLRRFPIALYASEMETILKMADQITTFISDNADDLARKA